MADILTKTASEVRCYVFDFTNRREVEAGETISTPIASVSPSGPTIGTPAVLSAAFDGIAAGKGVKATISGGTAGTSYTVSCSVVTSGGATLVSTGTLSVT